MVAPGDELALFERLVRIETKLDAFNERGTDHEARIRRLEKSFWIAVGAAATGGGVASQLLGPLIH